MVAIAVAMGMRGIAGYACQVGTAHACVGGAVTVCVYVVIMCMYSSAVRACTGSVVAVCAVEITVAGCTGSAVHAVRVTGFVDSTMCACKSGVVVVVALHVTLVCEGCMVTMCVTLVCEGIAVICMCMAAQLQGAQTAWWWWRYT